MTQVAAGQGEGLRFDRYMAGMDVMMWAVEQDPRLKLGIVSVLLLDRPVDPERFRAAVARTVAAGPRMRQVIVRSALSTAPPRFVEDPDFDLDYHTPVIAAPGEGTLDDVLRLAEHFGSVGFDYRRPLWEFCLVTGLQGGGCAILQKVHHVLTDGVGGLQLIVGPLLSATRRESPAGRAAGVNGHAGVNGAAGAKTVAALPSQATLLRDAQLAEARSALGAAGALARAAGSMLSDPVGSIRSATTGVTSLARYLMPAGGPLSPVMTGRSRAVHFETLTVPLGDLKNASHAAGGKLNDGLIAAVAAALASYHEQHDRPVRALRMYMPVNLRAAGASGRMGNEFSQALVDVPMHIGEPGERIRRIRELSAGAQRDPALRLFSPVAEIAGRLPAALVAPLFMKRLCDADFVLSNVPGPVTALYLGGAKVTHFYAFGPLGAGAMNVTAVSYHGQYELALATDPAAVPDPDVMLACLKAGLAEVGELGRQHANDR
jgi:diacylglycerol O-acyltransferase / wax synthase